MNFLVIRLSSLGDVLLATSAFSALHELYPDAAIWFVTDEKYVGLFQDDVRLARVIGIKKTQKPYCIPELHTVAWDRIVDLQNNGRSAVLRKKLSAKNGVGVFEKKHWERVKLLLFRKDSYAERDHVIARYAAAAGVHGAELFPATLTINKTVNADAYRSVAAMGMVRPMIALFPFSAWKNKQWSANFYGFVAKYFVVKGWNVFIYGDESEAMEAEQLRAKIGDNCISVAGKLSLYECAGLIKQSKLALGNDSGLSHLARACGVKTGIIYGSTTKQFGFFPYKGPAFKVFETPLFCRPCHAHGGNICFRGSHLCLKAIRPENVIAGLLALYHGE